MLMYFISLVQKVILQQFALKQIKIFKKPLNTDKINDFKFINYHN